MITPRLFIFSLCLILAICVLTQAKDWRGIVPLYSTRADVERLLGKPNLADRLDRISYGLEKERVSFYFAKGNCKEESEIWNVPKNTVIEIKLTPLPHTVLLLSDLKLEESKFEKVQHDHISWIVNYVNRDDGIDVEVENAKNQRLVTLITYFNTKKDNYLRCSEKKGQ